MLAWKVCGASCSVFRSKHSVNKPTWGKQCRDGIVACVSVVSMSRCPETLGIHWNPIGPPSGQQCVGRARVCGSELGAERRGFSTQQQHWEDAAEGRSSLWVTDPFLGFSDFFPICIFLFVFFLTTDCFVSFNSACPDDSSSPGCF